MTKKKKTTKKKTTKKKTVTKKTSAQKKAAGKKTVTMSGNALDAGKKAPAFSLPNHAGDKVSLSQFKGNSHVVLYFYPKDMTPGCTKQAEAFQKDLTKFKKHNVEIIGVSPDSPERHQKFMDKYGLKFHLVCDEDHKVAEKYGVWAEKSLYGRKFMGIVRSTFLIDKSGTVREVWPKVKVNGHSAEVLAAVKDL